MLMQIGKRGKTVRTKLNYEICESIAELLKPMSIKPFNWFVPNLYPKITDPREEVTNYFFAVVAQDFGFWRGNRRGYSKPVNALKNGKVLKGASFLWAASFEVYEENPEFFTATRMKDLKMAELKKWLSDDRKKSPVPMTKERLVVARDLGKSLCDNYDGAFTNILGACRGYLRRSRRGLLELLETFCGYADKPFFKKALLLAKILSSRPERFLKIEDVENKKVMIDYHLERLAERTGMIDISDRTLAEKLSRRLWVSPQEEYEIRLKALKAYDLVCKISGKDPFLVDNFFWEGRRYCPEMEEPVCKKCVLCKVCKGSRDQRYRKLFQPIIRTIRY